MARPKHQPSSLAKPTRDPARAALLLAATPVLIGGAVVLAMAMSAGRSPVGEWLKSMFRSERARTRAMRELLLRHVQREQPFPALRSVILGSAKGSVKAAFGPPRTALLGRGVTRFSIWRAHTWYYPLDRADRSAMAIRFEGNLAREVERISVPTEMAE